MQNTNYKLISDDLGAPRERVPPIIEKRPGWDFILVPGPGFHQLLPQAYHLSPNTLVLPPIFCTSLR